MPDIEKVVEALESCESDGCGFNCIRCHYETDTKRSCIENLMHDALELLKSASLIEWVTGRDPVLEEVGKDGAAIYWVREGYIVLDKHGQIFPAKYESVIIRGKRVRRWMWWNGNILDNGIVAWAKFPGMPDFAKKEGD